ncbi:MAG: hypothetical protein KGI60_02190 [Patescibacteria group bacterium]|nr:hypothetical protein [Patescibacteria group bacterium]
MPRRDSDVVTLMNVMRGAPGVRDAWVKKGESHDLTAEDSIRIVKVIQVEPAASHRSESGKAEIAERFQQERRRLRLEDVHLEIDDRPSAPDLQV